MVTVPLKVRKVVQITEKQLFEDLSNFRNIYRQLENLHNFLKSEIIQEIQSYFEFHFFSDLVHNSREWRGF